jgi:hypothetical protein
MFQLFALLFASLFASQNAWVAYPRHALRPSTARPNRALLMSDFPESAMPDPISSAENNEYDGSKLPFKGFGKKEIISSSSKSKEKTPVEIEADQKLEDEIRKTNMFKNMRQRREDALDSKIARLKEEEELIASDPSVGAVPEVVANRMLGRMVLFFGLPVFGGLAIFVGAFFYSKKYDVVIPPSIVAYATQAPFILGLLGITYAILSSSWDPETPGSALGFNEAKLNFNRIKEGISRTRETAELKEEIDVEKKKLGRSE